MDASLDSSEVSAIPAITLQKETVTITLAVVIAPAISWHYTCCWPGNSGLTLWIKFKLVDLLLSISLTQTCKVLFRLSSYQNLRSIWMLSIYCNWIMNPLNNCQSASSFKKHCQTAHRREKMTVQYWYFLQKILLRKTLLRSQLHTYFVFCF